MAYVFADIRSLCFFQYHLEQALPELKKQLPLMDDLIRDTKKELASAVELAEEAMRTSEAVLREAERQLQEAEEQTEAANANRKQGDPVQETAAFYFDNVAYAEEAYRNAKAHFASMQQNQTDFHNYVERYTQEQEEGILRADRLLWKSYVFFQDYTKLLADAKDCIRDVHKAAASLKPNCSYESNGYAYQTDNAGRIISASGELRLSDKDAIKRDGTAQASVGEDDRAPMDEGGHLIAALFGGSSGPENLVPMNYFFNRSGFKGLENLWAKELTQKSRVFVKMEPCYTEASKRPTAIKVKYTVIRPNGATFSDGVTLINEDLRRLEWQSGDGEYGEGFWGNFYLSPQAQTWADDILEEDATGQNQ